MSDYLSQQSTPLRAAEVQYFRIPRQNWGTILTRVHQMGADAISTSLYWGWHEMEEGQFDVTGRSDPRRDVVGFVNLCAEFGFKLVARAGPFIGAGVLGGGIPVWLLHRHPEIRALHADGKPWESGSPKQLHCSYTHPVYLEYVRHWYEKVAEALVPLQGPSGPIVALQVDHEMSGNEQRSRTAVSHFKGDYNPHVTGALWPVWLRKRYENTATLNAAYGTSHTGFSDVPLPREWHKPTTVQELRRYVDVDRFADWSLAYGLLTYVKMLRAVGWTVPVYHNLAHVPWERTGLSVSTSSMNQACGWLSQDLRSEQPACTQRHSDFDFFQYVHDAHWRPKLLKSYAPQRPALASQASAKRPFDLQAPYLGGLDAMSIYPALQADPDPKDVGTFLRWGMDAPIRSDGSPRQGFWNVKTLFTYLSASVDFVDSCMPADVALGYNHAAERVVVWGVDSNSLYEGESVPPPLVGVSQWARGANAGLESQRIAQQLVRHKVAFDVLDVDRVTGEQLARYPAFVIPAASVMSRKAQQRLVEYAQGGGYLLLVGTEIPTYDEALEPCSILRNEAGEQVHRITREKMLALDSAGWEATLEPSAARVRLAWADAPQVDVGARYGPKIDDPETLVPRTIFLTVANRSQDVFDGTVHYLTPDGTQQQVQLSLGSVQVGFVALRQGRVISSTLCGQHGGHVRTEHNRFAFDGQSGVAATMENVIVLSARDPGTFTLSQTEGWDRIAAQRLLFDGRLLDHPVHVEGQTLTVDYSAEDDLGRTDLLLLLDPGQPLIGEVQRYLGTLLACRRGMLKEAGQFAEGLRVELGDVEARAEVVPAGSVPLSPTRDALFEAIRSINKAAHYAEGLRDVLEGRTTTHRLGSDIGRVRVTAQGLAHLVAIHDAVAKAGDTLAEAAEQSRLPDTPWTSDEYVSRADALTDTVASIRQELDGPLCDLCGDLQARKVEREFGERVEQMLTRLLHVLYDF